MLEGLLVLLSYEANVESVNHVFKLCHVMYVQFIGKNGPMLKTKVTDKPRVGWVYL